VCIVCVGWGGRWPVACVCVVCCVCLVCAPRYGGELAAGRAAAQSYGGELAAGRAAASLALSEAAPPNQPKTHLNHLPKKI
jgi:hypothetical protein